MFDEALDRFEDVPGIKPDGGEDNAHEDRQQNKPADHRKRRAAKKAMNKGLGRSRV
jgi:hypothetical protein